MRHKPKNPLEHLGVNKKTEKIMVALEVIPLASYIAVLAAFFFAMTAKLS